VGDLQSGFDSERCADAVAGPATAVATKRLRHAAGAAVRQARHRPKPQGAPSAPVGQLLGATSGRGAHRGAADSRRRRRNLLPVEEWRTRALTKRLRAPPSLCRIPFHP